MSATNRTDETLARVLEDSLARRIAAHVAQASEDMSKDTDRSTES